MKLVKSKVDEKKEENDLNTDPTLMFLANIHAYKFNVGDILIKKHLMWDDEGEKKVLITETDNIGAPVKYVYAFENKLGVGYIKKLKNDGKGPNRSNPTCITKVVQRDEMLQLDPDYCEHLLLSHDEDFKYNARYESIKAFREEALKKNEALFTKVCDQVGSDDVDPDDQYEDTKEFKAFWKTLKVGDIIYAGNEIDDVGVAQLEVLHVAKNGRVKLKIIKDGWGWRDVGHEFTIPRGDFKDDYTYATTSRPYPLTEDNI